MADRRRLLAALAVSLVAAGCSWSQIGFDASHNSSNPLETGLTTENVTSLRLGWQTTTAEGGPPIIAAGFVFITNVQVPQLEAYSAVGSTNCAGTPKTCGPVWTAPISSGSIGGPAAFADGKVFVSATGNGQWHLEGFDANGNTNCSGAPKVCRPMWTASWGSSVADAAGTRVSAAAGRVYVDASGHPVTAFDATGAANCTTGNPRVCTPLFTAPAAVYQGLVFSTVAVGRLFVPADGGKTQVFDANGRSGCTNGLCSPLYALATPGHVSVSGSLAYAIAAGPGPLQVFDATGQRGCSGTPRLCQPIWTAPIAGAALGGWPTIAGGYVFVPQHNTPEGNQVTAYDAAGTRGCAGSPEVCSPLWHAVIPGSGTMMNASATASLLFIASWVPTPSAFLSTLSAYDLAGVKGCTGTPVACSPLWSTTIATNDVATSPAVALGDIAVTGPTGYVKVFSRP